MSKASVVKFRVIAGYINC